MKLDININLVDINEYNNEDDLKDYLSEIIIEYLKLNNYGKMNEIVISIK